MVATKVFPLLTPLRSYFTFTKTCDLKLIIIFIFSTLSEHNATLLVQSDHVIVPPLHIIIFIIIFIIFTSLVPPYQANLTTNRIVVKTILDSFLLSFDSTTKIIFVSIRVEKKQSI